MPKLQTPAPQFPSIPARRANDYSDRFRDSGLPVNAAKLAFALDKGLFSLAREVWRLNTVTVAWKNGPIHQKDIAFPKILHILTTVSKSLILTIIRNELHTTLKPPVDTSLRLPQPAMGPSYENPIIYALVHSDYTGVTPTKLEYLACLQKMKAYAKWYDSDKDPNWVTADKLARCIDYAKGLKPYRDWLDLNEVAWTLDEDGNKIPHARRYRKNHAQKQKIMKFAEELEIRLERIPQSQQNKPVPWSPCYIGWTRTPELRKATHYSHSGDDGVVRNLLEATMQVVAPYKQYFMHFIPLTNILDPDDAAIAEHLLSILASSYTMFGGLNGTVGGCGAVQKNARKYGKDRTWEIAAQSLIKQDLFQRNADKIEKEVDATAFLFQYKDKGSESTELETIHERIQRADHDIETANECLRQKVTEYLPIKKSVLGKQSYNEQLEEGIEELIVLKKLLDEITEA